MAKPKSDTPEEVWKPIAGHAVYEVSNLGRVRRPPIPAQIMKLTQIPHGYRVVGLRWADGPKKRRTWLVHRLVALAFLGEPPPDRTYVNHKNFNTSDNRIENLEWVSHQENIDHSNKAKRRTPASMIGIKNSNTSLTEENIRTIRELRASGVPRNKIAAAFGIVPEQVWVIATKRQWKHIK